MARRRIAGAVLLLMVVLAASARADPGLELQGGRFRVTATWRTPAGASGAAQALPLTEETGLFWFFAATNAELVVKILNACERSNHFWIYAAGLTNVQVELTVEDTWTGQTKSYSRSSGPLFAPIADTATFEGCGVVTSPCGQGTSAQIAATPRPNPEAETLALLLGPGVTADPAIYSRLDDDLTRIRTLYPSLNDVGFALIWDPSTLFVELTPEAYAAAKAGTFHEWDCLNGWYRGEVDHIYDFSPTALLQFEGLFHPVRIGADYEALPGVTGTSPNAIGYPAGDAFNDFCVEVDGAAYTYFFNDLTGGEAWEFRVPQPGAAPVVVQHTWSHDIPTTWESFEECRTALVAGAER